jgi:hypothetical protein
MRSKVRSFLGDERKKFNYFSIIKCFVMNVQAVANAHESGLYTFRVLGVSFHLILLGAFLAFSSLGAGSGKRTRKPLGAHQESFFDRNEREHGCCDLQPNYVSCIGIRHQ